MINRISIVSDIVIPIALYYAMSNHSNVIALVLLGMVVITRLALVITTK
jgi:ABC-type arginine/histidine transport system permease subunit